MNPATAGFPGGKDLAGLWRVLEPSPSQSLWIGHLLLHRIEAPVEIESPSSPAPLFRATLRALELGEPATLVALAERLPIGTGLLARQLIQLAAKGLVEPVPPSAWRLTSAGRNALQSQAGPWRQVERHTFHFLEVGPAQPPVFVPLAPGCATPVENPGQWHFTLQVLVDCLSRDRAVKASLGIPTEVVALHHPHFPATVNSDAAASPGPIIDCAEMLTAALVLEHDCWWHPLDARNWRRLASEPAVQLAGEHPACVALRQFLLSLPAEAEQRAWLEWARKRGLAEKDAQACQVSRENNVLQVHPPAALTPRLRRLPVAQEGFLLVGDGPLRRAVRIHIATGPPSQRLR